MEIYKVTARFPADERFGLTSQVRRASVSVPSNVAEGHGRQTTKEFINFLYVAYGSLNESQTQIMIGQRLGFISEQQCAQVLEQSYEAARLLNGLINSLVAKLNS